MKNRKEIIFIFFLLSFVVFPCFGSITRGVKAVVSFNDGDNVIRLETDKNGYFRYEFNNNTPAEVTINIAYKNKKVETRAHVLEKLENFTGFEGEEASWTFLTCFDGRGGLEKYVEENVRELEDAGSSKAVKVFLFFINPFKEGDADFVFVRGEKDVPSLIERGILSARVGLDDEEKLELKQIFKHSLILRHKTTQGSIPYSFFSDFLKESISWSPSFHYLLSINSHGFGYGIFFANLKEIKESLRAYKDKINMLIFDSCLMGSCEVIYEFKDAVAGAWPTLIASPSEVPASGLPYGRIIEKLCGRPEVSSKELAALIINQYINYCDEIGYMHEIMSGYDLTAVLQFTEDLNEFGKELCKALKEGDALEIILNRKIEGLYYNEKFGLADLEELISCIEEGNISPGLNKLCERLRQDLKALVFICEKTDTKIKKDRGVSIFFPRDRVTEYNSGSEKYEELDLFGKDAAPCWFEFVRMWKERLK